jgi:chromosome segregation ATPase
VDKEKPYRERITELTDEIMALKLADTRLADGIEQLDVTLKELIGINRLTLTKLLDVSKQNAKFSEIIQLLYDLNEAMQKLEPTMHQLDDAIYRLSVKVEELNKRQESQQKARDSLYRKVLEKLEEV